MLSCFAAISITVILFCVYKMCRTNMNRGVDIDDPASSLMLRDPQQSPITFKNLIKYSTTLDQVSSSKRDATKKEAATYGSNPATQSASPASTRDYYYSEDTPSFKNM